ncbi:MAG TPA: hypothetical protein PLK80_05230 [bacterium]|nr:MAG: hypothetical protein BWY28_01956 [bacterium ADurb.Bin236]HPI76117.1 hypothetical protein [bacterium]HPN93638.1 hypothetical protein [bacterium]
MLLRFGIEPGRAAGMTMKQFNAVCAFMDRERAREAGDGMLNELKEKVFGASGGLRRI